MVEKCIDNINEVIKQIILNFERKNDENVGEKNNDDDKIF